MNSQKNTIAIASDLRRIAAGSLVAALARGASTTYGADETATWINTEQVSGDGDWSDASKLSTTDYPDNGNGGVATYNANISSSGVVVALDEDVAIESFTLDGDSATDLVRSADLTINDTFTWNQGPLERGGSGGTLTLAAAYSAKPAPEHSSI